MPHISIHSKTLNREQNNKIEIKLNKKVLKKLFNVQRYGTRGKRESETALTPIFSETKITVAMLQINSREAL